MDLGSTLGHYRGRGANQGSDEGGAGENQGIQRLLKTDFLVECTNIMKYLKTPA